MKQLSKFSGLTVVVVCTMCLLAYYQPHTVNSLLSYHTHAIQPIGNGNLSQHYNHKQSRLIGNENALKSQLDATNFKDHSAIRMLLGDQNKVKGQNKSHESKIDVTFEHIDFSYNATDNKMYSNYTGTANITLQVESVVTKKPTKKTVSSRGKIIQPVLSSSSTAMQKEIDRWRQLYSKFNERRYDFPPHRLKFGERYSSDGKKITIPRNENLLKPFGKNYRNLTQELYQLAPEIFDFVPQDFLPQYKSPCWKLTGKMYCMPYFYIMGFPKCGTTDVWDKVIHHPQMAPVKSKEPHFWRDRSTSFKSFKTYLMRGEPMVRDIMRTGRTDLVYGDGSATTAFGHYNLANRFFPDAEDGPPYTNADIIRNLTPNAKLIVMIREPVARLYSGYLYHDMNKHKSPMLFHHEVTSYLFKFNECLKRNTFRACLYEKSSSAGRSFRLKVGMYLPYIQEWLRVFPIEQLKVIRLEDWMHQCQTILPEIFEFLELEPLPEHRIEPICKKPVLNTGKQYKIGPMLNKTKFMLDNFYSPYKKQLSEFFHQVDSEWDKSYLEY